MSGSRPINSTRCCLGRDAAEATASPASPPPTKSPPPKSPPPTKKRWLFAARTLIVGVAILSALIAVGVMNSYEALRTDRVDVVPKGHLAGAFFALPWEGDDAAKVVPLSDPTDAWLRRWELVHGAKHDIDVAYFILEGDVFGLSFLGALLAAAERGVVVRVLVDGLATDMADTSHTLTGENFLRALATHPNIDVRVSRPHLERIGSFLTNLQVGSLIASEHDKILDVDGKSTLTGGRNIALDYFTPTEHPGRQFIDTDVWLQSPDVVNHMRAAFERLYDTADAIDSMGVELSRRETVERAHQRMKAWLEGRDLDFSEQPDLAELERHWQDDLSKRPEYRGALNSQRPDTSLSARVRVIDTGTRLKPQAREITQTLLQLVADATDEIILISPYLVLGESLTSALAEAERRGVRITVLTNSPLSSDNAVSQALFLDQWPALLSRVKTLRLFVIGGEDTLHTKVMLFDRSVTLVGTYNLDPTAMRMSSELMVGLWSKPINRLFRQQITRRIDAGEPSVFRYRIKLQSDGTAALDEHGKPIVAFGPQDHLTQEQLEGTDDVQALIDGVRQTLGLEPLVLTADEASSAEGSADGPDAGAGLPLLGE